MCIRDRPKLNVNGTGDKFICSTDGMSVIADIWRDKETVDFVYDGSWWIAIGCLYATTAYYGLTKLSSSISSSSTTLAANSLSLIHIWSSGKPSSPVFRYCWKPG